MAQRAALPSRLRLLATLPYANYWRAWCDFSRRRVQYGMWGGETVLLLLYRARELAPATQED